MKVTRLCALNALAVGLMLVFGSTNTVSLKVQSDTYATEFGGGRSLFRHAAFQVLLMFVGQSVVLLWGVLPLRCRPRRKPARVPIRKSASLDQPKKEVFQKVPLYHPIVVLPTAFDLVATFLANTALLYVNASAWQMLRSSYLIFTGLVSVALGKKVFAQHWIAMLLSVAGAILVGLSSLLRIADDRRAVASASLSVAEPDLGPSPAIEILWSAVVVLSQLPRAIKSVLEAKVMLRPYNFTETELLAVEGLWGTFATVFVLVPLLFLIPGSQRSFLPWKCWDNSFDAVAQFFGTPEIWGAGVIYMVSVQVYGVSALRVTHDFSPVDRAIVNAVRALFVWVIQLFTYYVISEKYGEDLSRWSWLQALGFAAMVVAMFISNGAIKLPRVNYEAQRVQKHVEMTPAEHDIVTFAPSSLPPSAGGGNMILEPLLPPPEESDELQPEEEPSGEK